MRKPIFWFPTWSDTNQAEQVQKTVRGLKVWIKNVEGLYHLCSENKGADQLRGEPDQRLCFRICRMLVFHDAAQISFSYMNRDIRNPAIGMIKRATKCQIRPMPSTVFC